MRKMAGVNVLPAIVSNHICCYFRLGIKGLFFSACLYCLAELGPSLFLTFYVVPLISARKKCLKVTNVQISSYRAVNR